jgi:uncharacterized protein
MIVLHGIKINNMLKAEDLIKLLDLKPHPEGGFFKEIYRSQEKISTDSLPERYDGERNFGTSIYYLLTEGTFSAIHRLKSDEIFHFYLGDPVMLLMLSPDGTGEKAILGPDIEKGESLQIIVPKGFYQGLKLIEGGKFALMGTTVAPGFDPSDFEMIKYEELKGKYEIFDKEIKQLIRIK